MPIEIEITDNFSVFVPDGRTDTDQCEECLRWTDVRRMNVVDDKFLCDGCKKKLESG